MLSSVRKLTQKSPHHLYLSLQHIRHIGSGSYTPEPRPRRRHRRPPPATMRTITDDKSEWWAIDGEMHEIGENVPLRERFVIPRDNIPNRRRKQLREQFMRRTRLVLKDSEQESWCKKYMQLYNELRENWERLYWDEGYSKKLAVDHANYDSPEDDDDDFSPYRRGRSESGPMQGEGPERNRNNESWQRVSQIRDKFEYDRENRMRDKAFAPMNMSNAANDDRRPTFRNEPFDARKYFSGDDED